MSESNGHGVKLPCITVSLNPIDNTPIVNIDDGFKSLEFAAAVLQMASDGVGHQAKVARLHAQQQMALQQAQGEALAQKLKLGR